jgi:hypothetical protein
LIRYARASSNYSDLIYNDFLHWDFIWSTAYGRFCFTQGFGLSRFQCTQLSQINIHFFTF